MLRSILSESVLVKLLCSMFWKDFILNFEVFYIGAQKRF